MMLEPRLSLGVQTVHRRTEPAAGPWLPAIDSLVALTELVDQCGYDSMWVGDHLAFAVPILDPLLQIAQCAVVSRRLRFGTGVYLLALRHPTPVAKQVATLDHLTEGRLIFGVGAGGEFPAEFAASGVPVAERGARLAEGVAVLRKLWSGAPADHSGRFYGPFAGVTMAPPPRQEGGPPIWFGGRAAGALRRCARLGQGYLSYVVTPEQFATHLGTIASAREATGPFGTGHLLFTRLDATRAVALDRASETLSVRYGMDFRRAADRYCALGPPEAVAGTIRAFHAAGVRHVVLDFLGPYEERAAQISWFAASVMPLLGDLRAG